MRGFNRVILSFYAIITIVLSTVSSLFLFFPSLLIKEGQAVLWSSDYYWFTSAFSIFLALIFLLSIYALIYCINSSRLSRTRLRATEIGVIDIAVHAIENIALNSAKTAHAGIKTAKAKVYSDQNKGVYIEMFVNLYSDIEIPTQMTKVQERIKKDIERFTGIPVTEVSVRVLRVELQVARIEN